MKKMIWMAVAAMSAIGTGAWADQNVSLKIGEVLSVRCPQNTVPDVFSTTGSSVAMRCARVCKVAARLSGMSYSMTTFNPATDNWAIERGYCYKENLQECAGALFESLESDSRCDRVVAVGWKRQASE